MAGLLLRQMWFLSYKLMWSTKIKLLVQGLKAKQCHSSGPLPLDEA